MSGAIGMEKREAESQEAFRRAVHELSVQIVKFEDDSFPGWVRCELLDAEGRKHEFIEKVPVLTIEQFDENSSYPMPCLIACEVLAQWRDDQKRELTRVSTARPWAIESTEGLSEFTVPSSYVH